MTPAWADPPFDIEIVVFDYDGTLANDQSIQFHLFNKTDNTQMAVPWTEWSNIAHLVGQTPPYDNYETRTNPQVEEKAGTFREFTDGIDGNNFPRSINLNLTGTPDGSGPVKPELLQAYEGPAFKQLQEATKTRVGAQYTFLDTLRGQSPEKLREGFLILQTKGLINYVPPVENFMGLGTPQWDGLKGPEPLRKAISMGANILDKVQKSILETQKKTRVRFIFYDDTFANISGCNQFFKSKVSRWPNIEIINTFMGKTAISKTFVIKNVDETLLDGASCVELLDHALLPEGVPSK